MAESNRSPLLIGAARLGDRGCYLAAGDSTLTQSECLAPPHHFTYEGACYPGDVAYIGLSSADHPTPVTFTTTSVPEPGTAVVFAVALLVGLVSLRIRAPRLSRIDPEIFHRRYISSKLGRSRRA